GETPWPELAAPSAEQCEQVYNILRFQHADGHLRFERPPKVPPPSLEVAGCGETQLLVDGLCRTVLSGATSMKNADKTIRDVVEFYGTITKSIEIDGQVITPVTNCIDWDKVRLGGAEQLKAVIRSGGLQATSSKAILNILETTQNTNANRTAAFRQQKLAKTPLKFPGSDALTQAQKDMEIWMFDNKIISLEHLRALPTETAMNELVQLKGVGIKTAACVILFCLQEPCFAVDTHCFRMAKWLGWLPNNLHENSGREKAFAHLDLRIPDHLKYGLHQLFIEHGQSCHRCKAITKPGNKDWEASICPLEHLLNR
ncbi:DNA glycosylase, partial [Coniella lustricola]